MRRLLQSVLLGGLVAVAQGGVETEQRVTPNFKGADIGQIAESVSAVTGKTFIIDPRVHAQVTMLSSAPMSPAAFYQAFLAILEVHGFIAVEQGGLVKVLPDSNARQMPSVDLPERAGAGPDEIVTQIIDVRNVSAAQLVPILRPLIPQYGHLAAYPASNILIISDRANNVSRIVRIIRRIDQVGDQGTELVPLENASASEVARILTTLSQQQANAETPTQLMKVIADERSNSILISADQAQRLRLRALIAQLDAPSLTGGETQVRYLHYADAEKIAPKLKEQISGAAAPGSGASSAEALAGKSVQIWADPATNALIVTAPPKVMRAVMNIVDKLDIRRAQVLVEAIIVEVNADKTSDLGVNWATYSKGSSTPVSGFIEPVGGSSIVDLYNAYATNSYSNSALQGTTIGIGKFSGAGINFAATLRAIRGDSSSNIIATPSALMMDNEEAELKVAQEVPFITGQYTNASSNSSTSSSSSSVSPFQTVQRQDVGTIIKVTPTINAGNAVMLKISLESSSVATTSVSSVDITTNKRTINTRVLIEDGGVVVLGGLIQNNQTRSEQRVPFLGSIPLIGLAFKARNAQGTRTNLMVFIRPKILRDEIQTAHESDTKYEYMMNQQRAAEHKKELFPLLPGEQPPTLSPLPTPPLPTPGRETPPAAPGESNGSTSEATPTHP